MTAGNVRFIEAANYTTAHRLPHDIWYLVIHDEEAPQQQNEAIHIAEFFHGQTHGPQGTSAHRVVDNKHIIHCVRWHDIAWAAPGANTNGMHWEQSGYVSQDKNRWEDEYGMQQLGLLSADVASFAHTVGIRPVRLDPEQLQENERGPENSHHRGICGHDTVTKAFPKVGTHTDPGPHFPWHDFIQMVEHHYNRLR